jgi:hypothetical protein
MTTMTEIATHLTNAGYVAECVDDHVVVMDPVHNIEGDMLVLSGYYMVKVRSMRSAIAFVFDRS